MEIPRHWRLQAQRYRLEGSTCLTCGRLIFPPRSVCPHCTAQPAQILGGLPVSPAATRLTDIESHIEYQITERVIG